MANTFFFLPDYGTVRARGSTRGAARASLGGGRCGFPAAHFGHAARAAHPPYRREVPPPIFSRKFFLPLTLCSVKAAERLIEAISLATNELENARRYAEVRWPSPSYMERATALLSDVSLRHWLIRGTGAGGSGKRDAGSGEGGEAEARGAAARPAAAACRHVEPEPLGLPSERRQEHSLCRAGGSTASLVSLFFFLFLFGFCCCS